MKRSFEGMRYETVPEDWAARTADNPYLDAALLGLLRETNPTRFSMVTHRDYCCCEYETRLNLLTFSRFRLNVPLRVVAPPASLCGCGYTGSLAALTEDYRRRQGTNLVLNMDAPTELAACGETLGTCVLPLPFASFETYLGAMKSAYRRRIKQALKRAAGLEWRRVPGDEFTEEMYRLYRNVLGRSSYPLECLDAGFFQKHPGERYALCDGDTPHAFVLTELRDGRFSFLFGGMDYAYRDRYDLYMNMLAFLVRSGIDCGARELDLGQTAEASKMRVGAVVRPKYLCVFSGNAAIDFMLRIAVRFFTYRTARRSHAVWKRGGAV